MASSKKLQGITIEIDGNTTKLSDSLKNVNKTIATTQSELKNINSLLKLDPSNTTLLAQKQKVLADTIKGTSEKLNQLREAKKQADERIASGAEDKNSASYRELEREIIATENSLNKLNSELKENSIGMKTLAENTQDAGDKALKFGDILKANLLSSAIQSGIKGLANSFKQLTSSLIDIGKASIESLAEYEQLSGGVGTLFKGAAEDVEYNAQQAFKTAGMSANEYMETVTSFSASLISSLKGDTSKAAEVADMAITDMSDNANKMGTSIESIQNAYQGFAKQNYTMLDNLKLGYGGTKTEMDRLLKDATKISGIKYNINELSDVYEAIHVIQTELDITGATAAESSSTISGSIGSMKSAWKNMLSVIASNRPDFGLVMQDFIDSVLTVANNLMPVLETTFDGLVNLVVQFSEKLLPQILSMGVKLINQLAQGIITTIPTLIPVVTKLIGTLINTIISLLPKLIEMGITIILELINGITQSLPNLIPTLVEVIILIVETITENLPMIIEAGIDLILNLALGIIDAIPTLIEKIPDIIVKIVMALTEPKMLTKLINAGIKLLLALGQGLVKAIPEVLTLVPTIFGKLLTNFSKVIKDTNWKKLGKSILDGILNGMLNFGKVVEDTIKKVGKKITSSIKSFFGIKSPSRLMKKEVGKYLASGIAVGFEEEMPNTIRDVQSSLSSLNTGIQASVNPVINPQANTNPLIIQIENFNNSRGSDIQALAEELEFYRKRTSLATGGN